MMVPGYRAPLVALLFAAAAGSARAQGETGATSPLASTADIASARMTISLLIQSHDPESQWPKEQVARAEAKANALPLAHLVALLAEPETPGQTDRARSYSAGVVAKAGDPARPLVVRAIAVMDPRKDMPSDFQAVLSGLGDDKNGSLESALLSSLDACYRARTAPILAPVEGLAILGTKKALPALYGCLILASTKDPATIVGDACRTIIRRSPPADRDAALKPLVDVLGRVRGPSPGVAEAVSLFALSSNADYADPVIRIVDILEAADFADQNATALDCLTAAHRTLLDIRSDKAVARVLHGIDLTVPDPARRLAALNALARLNMAPHAGQNTAGHFIGPSAQPPKLDAKVVVRLADVLGEKRTDEERDACVVVLRALTGQQLTTADEWRDYARKLANEK